MPWHSPRDSEKLVLLFSNIELNLDLFDVTKKGSACHPLHISSLASQLQDRLTRTCVPPPTSLQDALKLMKSSVHLTLPSFTSTALLLEGLVNLVKLVVFTNVDASYSRASDLIFVPKTTNSTDSHADRIDFLVYTNSCVSFQFAISRTGGGGVLMN